MENQEKDLEQQQEPKSNQDEQYDGEQQGEEQGAQGTEESSEDKEKSDEEIKAKAFKNLRKQNSEFKKKNLELEKKLQEQERKEREEQQQRIDPKEIARLVEEQVSQKYGGVIEEIKQAQEQKAFNETYDLLRGLGASKEDLEKLLEKDPKLASDRDRFIATFVKTQAKTNQEYEKNSGKQTPSFKGFGNSKQSFKSEKKAKNSQDFIEEIKRQADEFKGIV